MLRPYVILLLLVIASCTKNAEEVIKVDPDSRQSFLKELIAFTDTANHLPHRSIEHNSLVYTQNDYSFYVTRYVRNSEPFLYLERGYSTIRGDIENKYYLKAKQIVLSIQDTYNSRNALPFKTVRTF